MSQPTPQEIAATYLEQETGITRTGTCMISVSSAKALLAEREALLRVLDRARDFPDDAVFAGAIAAYDALAGEPSADK